MNILPINVVNVLLVVSATCTFWSMTFIAVTTGNPGNQPLLISSYGGPFKLLALVPILLMLSLFFWAMSLKPVWEVLASIFFGMAFVGPFFFHFAHRGAETCGGILLLFLLSLLFSSAIAYWVFIA